MLAYLERHVSVDFDRPHQFIWLYLPVDEKLLRRKLNCSSSLRSRSPVLSVSSLSNSADIKVIHSCLEILPFLSVSIRKNKKLTSSSLSPCLSPGAAAALFCTNGAVANSTAKSRMISLLFFLIAAS